MTAYRKQNVLKDNKLIEIVVDDDSYFEIDIKNSNCQ
jgi:hypothetical protein